MIIGKGCFLLFFKMYKSSFFIHLLKPTMKLSYYIIHPQLFYKTTNRNYFLF